MNSPGRSQIFEGDDSLNDESKIIKDQDETFDHGVFADALKGIGPANSDLEDEPEEFMQGEIDVKTQMDRTTRIAEANAHGHHDLDDSPEMTPGGIEEAAAKTDQDLALHRRRSAHRPEGRPS